MTPEDARLKKHVQAILVRNYVDTQHVEVDVISSNVYVDGEFHVGGARNQVDDENQADSIEAHHVVRRTLQAIESQIRSAGNINGLYFKFTNWAKTGTGWAPKRG